MTRRPFDSIPPEGERTTLVPDYDYGPAAVRVEKIKMGNPFLGMKLAEVLNIIAEGKLISAAEIVEKLDKLGPLKSLAHFENEVERLTGKTMAALKKSQQSKLPGEKSLPAKEAQPSLARLMVGEPTGSNISGLNGRVRTLLGGVLAPTQPKPTESKGSNVPPAPPSVPTPRKPTK